MKRAATIVFAVLVTLQLAAVLLAPPAWQVARIGIALGPGESITVGERELATPQAEARQLTLRRNSRGDWLASSAGSQRQPILKTATRDVGMGHSVIAAGMRFQAGSAEFTVTAADDDGVQFSSGGTRWHYDGAVLRRAGKALPACPGSSLSQGIAGWWNRSVPAAIAITRPALLGGSLHCGNRIGIAHADPGSATLRRDPDGQWILAAAPGQLVRVDGGASAEYPLADARAIVIGRTLLAIHQQGDTLVLLPKRHAALFREAVVQLPRQVSWTWEPRSLWRPSGDSISSSLVVLAAAMAVIGAGLVRFAWRDAAGAGACLVAGAAAFLAQRSGQPLPVALSLLAGAAACWHLLQYGRGQLLPGSAALLAAAGLLVQLEMGLGAAETSWLRHVQKSAALLALGVGGGLLLAQAIRSRRQPWSQLQLELLLAGLGALALLGLAAQVVLGNETGVFDLQPVEFAKLALAAVTAHCLAVGLGWHSHRADGKELRLRWLRLAAPAMLFLALLGLALVQVNDFSPLILLAVWLLGMLLAYAAAARRAAWMGAIGCVILAGCLAIGWLRASGAEQLANAGFYGDRFQVWVDPALHPHTGQQFLLAAESIAEGGWRGADGWFGLARLGDAAGAVMQVPAVQDDFAPAFLLNRHGLAGALLVWLLQCLFLAGLLGAAIQAHRAAFAARHYRQAWLGRWRCFALAGGAAFVAGHLLLSWGTNLSIFPIMGQPMSFLSSGGSHLLLFLCPLLALGVVSTQSNQEISSCQSMSNAKSSAK